MSIWLGIVMLVPGVFFVVLGALVIASTRIPRLAGLRRIGADTGQTALIGGQLLSCGLMAGLWGVQLLFRPADLPFGIPLTVLWWTSCVACVAFAVVVWRGRRRITEPL